MSMEQGVYSYGLLEDSTVFVLCQALRRDERHVHNLSLRNQFADQVEPLVQFPVVLFRHRLIFCGNCTYNSRIRKLWNRGTLGS